MKLSKGECFEFGFNSFPATLNSILVQEVEEEEKPEPVKNLKVGDNYVKIDFSGSQSVILTADKSGIYKLSFVDYEQGSFYYYIDDEYNDEAEIVLSAGESVEIYLQTTKLTEDYCYLKVEFSSVA